MSAELPRFPGFFEHLVGDGPEAVIYADAAGNKVMGGAQSRYGGGALVAVPALDKDGRQIAIEFAVLPFRGDSGTFLGIAAFLRDATARFEEVRALRRARAGV
jgi:hypothetical protein